MSGEESTITKEKKVETLSRVDLRDYFAGQALAYAWGATPKEKAKYAYACADAMLKEREKQNEKT